MAYLTNGTEWYQLTQNEGARRVTWRSTFDVMEYAVPRQQSKLCGYPRGHKCRRLVLQVTRTAPLVTTALWLRGGSADNQWDNGPPRVNTVSDLPRLFRLRWWRRLDGTRPEVLDEGMDATSRVPLGRVDPKIRSRCGHLAKGIWFVLPGIAERISRRLDATFRDT